MLKYGSLIGVQENGEWGVIYLSKSLGQVEQKFEELVTKISEEDEILNKSIDVVYFDSGKELWLGEAKGEDCESNYRYVIVYEDGEGFKIDSVHCSENEAKERLIKIKNSYLKDGYKVFKEYDDLIIFDNDDFYKIQKISLDILSF